MYKIISNDMVKIMWLSFEGKEMFGVCILNFEFKVTETKKKIKVSWEVKCIDRI